jgi:hypothetical protein
MPSKKQTVDEFMAELDHPFKAEVQAVREIIKKVHKGITEEVKWKAPSFSYKGYLATFNLWAKNHVHLVFHNGAILDPKLGILEGSYPDRRMVYFANMDEVRAKKAALVKAVKEWVRLMDKKNAIGIAENKDKAMLKAGGSKPATQRSRSRGSRTPASKGTKQP